MNTPTNPSPALAGGATSALTDLERELLDALEDALAIFGPEPGDAHPAPKWEIRARAAIAKATL